MCVTPLKCKKLKEAIKSRNQKEVRNMKHIHMSANLLKIRANFDKSIKKPEDIEPEVLKPEDKYNGNIGLQTL